MSVPKISKIHKRVNAAKVDNPVLPLGAEKGINENNNLWDQMRSDHEQMERDVIGIGASLVTQIETIYQDPEKLKLIKNPIEFSDAVVLASKDIQEQTAMMRTIRKAYKDKSGSAKTIEDMQLMLQVNGEMVESAQIFQANFAPTLAVIAKNMGVVDEVVKHQLQHQEQTAELATVVENLEQGEAVDAQEEIQTEGTLQEILPAPTPELATSGV
jgi:hypothetical protein